MFLPPNTTSLIQPLDQTVIVTFKSYYLRLSIRNMLEHVNTKCSNENEISNQSIVKNFWKQFSILFALTFVDDSWKEVANSTLNARWSKLLPEVMKSQNDARIKLSKLQAMSLQKIF